MGPRPEYPRPQFRREEWHSLNGKWEFGAGSKPVFDRTINVPFCPESELSGIGERVGDVVWYRRGFDRPRGDRVMLHFGAVDYRATVWVNDVEVAQHEGGHSPFSADITNALQSSRNTVVVRADDSLTDKTIPRGKQYWKEEPEGIFYSATTGIWQSVWLEPLRSRHVSTLRVIPHLEAGTVEFAVDAGATVVVRLDGEVLGESNGEANAVIALSRVEPWSPDSPRLYDVEVTLDGDRVESYFGLRSIETRDSKLWLNGERFVERLVLDQGYFSGGLLTAPTDDALRRDIELAKAMGFNGARKHQKAEDPRWLYWADRLGFLVWSEMPGFYEFSPDAERRTIDEWSQLVRRDRDHPSVVAWVVANESFGLETPSRSEFVTGLYDLTRRLDNMRPIISNDGWEHARSDICTIHDYSAPADLAQRYRALDTALRGAGEHEAFDPGYAYEGQPVIVSEFGGLRIAGTGGWGWLEVKDSEEFVRSYGELIDALMAPGPVEGFCYTQLTDVQQETNGLLTAEREPKVDVEQLRPLTQTEKSS
jgi:beta-galactosidase/beta-glucuronidase